MSKGKGEKPKANAPSAIDQALTKWTFAELMAVKHLGPGIIGQEMYEASQKLSVQTGGGVYGPALLGIVTDQNKPAPQKTDEPKPAA